MLIGLAGEKYAGKDTAGDVFESFGAYRAKFARPLKLMLAALLAEQGVDEDTIVRMLDGDLKEVETPYLNGRTPRHAMQTLGTEWARVCMGDDFWINIFQNVVNGRGADLVVCTDVRFPNEVERIKAMGGVVYRVERGEPTDPEGLHPSEAQIRHLKVDGTLRNDAASAEEFQAQVALLFGPMMEA